MGNRSDARKLPDGIEWPRYEDGRLVDIGHILDKGMAVGIEMRSEGYRITCLNGSIQKPYGERIKRPALAADGEIVREGETVWNAATGEEFKVVDARDGYAYLSTDGGVHVNVKLLAGAVTHVRPVLDADNVPIHDGDTLYAVKTGRSCKVLKAVTSRFDDRALVEFDAPELDEKERTIFCPVRYLTHKRPVLDADGAPLKAGQTVWVEQNGDGPYVIEKIGRFSKVVDCHYKDNENDCLRIWADLLTGKRPVFDANDVLIRPGDVVYANADASGDGTAWRVRSLNHGLAHSVNAERADGSNPALVRDLVPAWLTHEPDTWERIEANALVIDQLIDSEWGGDPKDARNLVRRCKRLAERGE